jgi:hypothetical protein
MSLKKKFETARPGDFIVTHVSHHYSLLLVRAIDPSLLCLEEITVPEGQVDASKINWSKWVQTQAPGHTSWVLYRIDLTENKLKDSYCFSKKQWLFHEESENLFSKMISLPLLKTPLEQRRRIGPPPLAGEVDQRALWIPPLIINGKKISKAPFDVWQAKWPNDASPLSGCIVDLYFHSSPSASPFPFWIEVQSTHYSLKIRGVNSGSGLVSPMPLPTRSSAKH